MKKTISIVLMLAISVLAANAYAGKMDLMLKMGLGESTNAKAMLGKSLSTQDGVEIIDLLIKSTDTELTSAGIENAGGSVRSVIGDIMTAFVPIDFLDTLEGYDEVVAIEASKRMNLSMDSARSNSGVASVQNGSYDGTSYTGKNVIVGAIDSGLDYSRNDFKDADFENTRVQYLAFQSVSSGGEVTVTECKYTAINSGDCASSIPASNDSVVGHGTHILGIAAGNGGGTDYIGCATAADIMLYRNDFDDDINEATGSFSSGILDGISKIFTKADVMDKPAVINISQGTHVGAHDNTSLMEQGINSALLGEYATGGKSYGRSVVVAAGNEHIVYEALTDATIRNLAGGIHASIDVQTGVTSRRGWRFWVLSSSSPGRTPLLMDIWFGTGQKDNCKVSAYLYEYSSVEFLGAATGNAVAEIVDLDLSAENDATDATPGGEAEISGATDPSDTQNSKPRAMISFGPGDSGSWNDIVVSSAPPSGYFLDIVVEADGGDCGGNMWVEGGGTLVHFLKEMDAEGVATDVTGTGGYNIGDNDGDNDMSVGIPGTASSVVTVGAYLQEKAWGSGDSEWTGMDGVTYDATDINEPAAAQVNGGTVGLRTPFSSIGPTAYTYTGYKPDLLAPGDPIISVLASGHSVDQAIQVDSTHMKSQGTSQASPHIAGLVALMFEKNNTLTAAEVKNALTTGAGATGDDENGYGKVDAVSTMGKFASDSSGYSGTGNLDGDSDGGSSGCGGTIAPAASGVSGFGALMLMLPALLIAIRRRRE